MVCLNAARNDCRIDSGYWTGRPGLALVANGDGLMRSEAFLADNEALGSGQDAPSLFR